MEADDALNLIHDLLDGVEWTPETLNRIAEIMNSAGYPIRDLNGKTIEQL